MNELSIKTEEAIAIAKDKGLSEIVKPLQNEIHLFDTFIAGTSYVEDKDIFKKIKAGDELMLVREVNKFDEKAIKIMTVDKVKLGYIPEKDNIIFSRLLDAGKCIKAKVTKIEDLKSYERISIGIYLYDF